MASGMESRSRRGERYRRVCARVLQESHPNTTEARTFVTRNSDLSSRPSRSSLRDLPQVLGPPETPRAPKKPRKTLRSRSAVNVVRELLVKPLNVETAPKRASGSLDRRLRTEDKPLRVDNALAARGRSTPSVRTETAGWSDVHVSECKSSLSHVRLKELKDEINAFRESERWEELREKLRQSCGLELDELGNVVEPSPDDANANNTLRNDEHRAAVSDQQVKMATPTAYPIDKYLSMENPPADLLNIFGDDWSCEPAMKPEDEVMLKRLHNMLQATAEDLRELSSEIHRTRQPTVQVKTQPTPLDEEFNERVHIKEVVEAKFNGRILVDGNNMQKKVHINPIMLKPPEAIKEKKVNTGVQVNLIVNNSEDNKISAKPLLTAKSCVRELTKQKTEADKIRLTPNRPTNVSIAYEEFQTNGTPSAPVTPSKKYVIQEMPSVHIRSELKEQKVINLEILPNSAANKPFVNTTNSAVIEMDHDTIAPLNVNKIGDAKSETSVRKVMKIPCYESSDTISNSETETNNFQKNIKKVHTVSTTASQGNEVKVRQHKVQISTRNNENGKNQPKKSTSHRSSDDWKKKLNTIYDKPSTSRTPSSTRHSKTLNSAKNIQTKPKLNSFFKQNNMLKNSEYVPYSKLTLGGVNVSDIENELVNVTDKANMPLSPILDKILSSQDNSFQESPRQGKNATSRPLTKSDEKLLKEVLDMDRKIKKTLNKDAQNSGSKSDSRPLNTSPNEENDDNASYPDDFDEVEKSLHASGGSSYEKVENINVPKQQKNNQSISSGDTEAGGNTSFENSTSNLSFNNHNKISKNLRNDMKSAKLSLKHSVDVFEFVHSVDTNDIAIQSCSTQKISLKETQTSPHSEANVQPIYNELWEPSPFDTSGEVDTMFKHEKDFIKNFIIEEYGDIFEISKNIAKPSTSYSDLEMKGKNVASHPKDTQTSPSHVKSVMTSPMRMTVKTMSPFSKKLAVHRQASPLLVTNVDHSAARISESEVEDPGIAVNLSSPRFTLRLPQSSRDVLSNLGSVGPAASAGSAENPENSKTNVNKEAKKSKESKASSSESWNEETDTDVSSMGEVYWKLQRARARRNRERKCTMSESSSTSAVPSSVDGASDNVIPTKSEGEISLGQL